MRFHTCMNRFLQPDDLAGPGGRVLMRDRKHARSRMASSTAAIAHCLPAPARTDREKGGGEGDVGMPLHTRTNRSLQPDSLMPRGGRAAAGAALRRPAVAQAPGEAFRPAGRTMPAGRNTAPRERSISACLAGQHYNYGGNRAAHGGRICGPVYGGSGRHHFAEAWAATA